MREWHLISWKENNSGFVVCFICAFFFLIMFFTIFFLLNTKQHQNWKTLPKQGVLLWTKVHYKLPETPGRCIFSLFNHWDQICIATHSLQTLVLSMLASHTHNNDLLPDTMVLQFAQVTSLLSQVPAIQHQRHLHLGFNKHLSWRRNSTSILMRCIKYSQQLEWEWNSPELQTIVHYYQKDISTTWQTFMCVKGECHSGVFLSQNILI